MKLEESGNIITISDKPHLRRIAGIILLLFSLWLAFVAISYFLRDSQYALNFGMLISAFIFGAIGFRFIRKYPQIICEFDRYTQTLTYTEISFFGEKKKNYQLRELKSAKIANAPAFLDGDSNDGKFRVELIFRNGSHLPVTSTWRLSDHFCQQVADKINSTIPKLNQRKKEKPGSWKEEDI